MCRRGRHPSALSAAPVPVCHFVLLEDIAGLKASDLYTVDRAELCEQRDDEEYGVEDEEKDPVGPTQVEPAQWNNDEGQDQRQTQRSCEDPRQQTLNFKLRRRERDKKRCIMFTDSKTVSCICDFYISLYV